MNATEYYDDKEAGVATKLSATLLLYITKCKIISRGESNKSQAMLNRKYHVTNRKQKFEGGEGHFKKYFNISVIYQHRCSLLKIPLSTFSY